MKHASLFALGGMLAGKAGNAVAAQPATAAVTKVDAAKRIGLQIYSLGPELDKDVPGGMKRLKQMGYQTLELAGYNNGKVRGIDMMEFKKMADDAGLEILSSHVNPPVREYTKENLNTIKEYWKKTADDHAKMGAKYLVQPGQPSTRSVEETIQAKKALQFHVLQYCKTKPLRQEWKTLRSEKARINFRAQHESDLLLMEAAKRYFDQQGLQKLPSYKTLQREIEALVQEKNLLYRRYLPAREKFRELDTMRHNLRQLLRQPEQDRQREVR